MKKFLIIFLSSLLLISTSCSSYYIDYSNLLKNQIIDAKLYVPAPPGPEVKCGGIINARVEIEQNFRNIDIKEVVINEALSIPFESQKRVKLIVDKKFIEKNSLPLNNNYSQEMKKDPTISNYKFSTISDQIGTEYIIILKIDRIIWDTTGYFRGVAIAAEASMHEVKSDKVIWRTAMEKRKIIGITDGPAKDIEQLKKATSQTVSLIYEEMFKSINK